jgi:PAS domain S-box-containing protein
MSEAPPAPVGCGAAASDPNRVADEATTTVPGGDVLERVLASLLDLSFVLTDREGFVTRWTARAEQLVGLGSAEAAGRALLETFGAADEEVPAAGRLQIDARHHEAGQFCVELTFIPVPMSHSLEFNGFLESLESDRPTESVRRRVNSQHSDVLDWIGSVVTDGVPLHSDELTAGTIVAFRALEEVPWLAEPEVAPEPGQPQPALAHAVDRAAEVLARSDALERTLDEASETVEEARAMAETAHEEAASAVRRVSKMADENSTLRDELEHANDELGELRTRFDSAEAPATSREFDELRAEVAAIRAQPPAVTRDDVEALRAELQELAASQRGGETSAGAAERAEAALNSVRALAEELRAEVEGAREGAARAGESAGEAADVAAVEARVARVQAEAARVHSEEASGHALAAREMAEAWASAAERHGRADDDGASRAVDTPRRVEPELPAREPRPGFDDAPEAMAVIGLDGRFRELNPKFSELVGYKERDFQTASWPPVADRAKLERHRAQMRALVGGEVDSVEVNTGYVHAQGLLVPVVGTLSLERGEDGEPGHFLLSAQAPSSAAAA